MSTEFEALEIQRELLRQSVHQTVYLRELLLKQSEALAQLKGNSFPNQAAQQVVREAQEAAEAELAGMSGLGLL